jgi:hypothetical protein
MLEQSRNSVTLLRNQVKADAEYLMTKYGSEPALYRLSLEHGGKTVFYVYDSYHISPQDWGINLKCRCCSCDGYRDLAEASASVQC